jgi:hypothetical protein
MAFISNPVPATAKLSKQGTYTQTYSTATRVQAQGALTTNLSLPLLTEAVSSLNTTNTAVNELKQLVNGLIDDLQALELIG